MKLNFYDTPSHGYLRVSKKKFKEVGADPTQISKFSGHNETTLFLEEDCDTTYFLNFLKENGIPFEIKSVYRESFSITHNYKPSLFNFKLREGTSVRLSNGLTATLEFYNKTKLGARIKNGMLYRIPSSNPFQYISEKV